MLMLFNMPLSSTCASTFSPAAFAVGAPHR
jgi:hypothetical protein